MPTLFKSSLAALALGFATLAIQPAEAALVYQSATLGSDDTGGEVLQPGRSVAAVFSLSQATDITAIGGEFESGVYGGNTAFGAIISLADFQNPNTSPDDLSSVALAHALLNVPTTLPNTASPGYYTFGDVTAPLSVTLAAGDYVLIMGTGQFGSASDDNYPTLGDDNDPANSPTLYRTFYSTTWEDAPSYANFRVFIEGAPAAVPEPATWAMFIGGFGLVGGAMRARRDRTTVRFA